MAKLKSIISVAAITAVLAIGATAHAECGGVLMMRKQPGAAGWRDLVQWGGSYSLYGGLVSDGKSTCTSVLIECNRDHKSCRVANASTTQYDASRPEMSGIWIDDYQVTAWTHDRIDAEYHPTLGGVSQLHIVINDDVPDTAQIIKVMKSSAKPGEWETETLTVDDDPGYARQEPAHH